MSETSKSPPRAQNTLIAFDDPNFKPSPVASPQLPSAVLAPVHEEEPTAVDPSQPQNEANTESRRPSFAPFYALVSDTTSSTIYHPLNVHYVFSDDDRDVVTSACLAAVPGSSSQTSSGLSARSVSSSLEQSNPNSRQPKQMSPKDSRLPEHRTIIIDLDETGTKVTSAQSLSNTWQVLSTNISPAPTWDERPGGEEDDAAARFMLKVEGVNARDWRQEQIGKNKEVGPDDFKALADDFEAKMKMLSTIVEAGERRFGLDRAEIGNEEAETDGAVVDGEDDTQPLK